MSEDIGHDAGKGGILANKVLWLCIGLAVFLLIAFVLPTPQSVVESVDKYGFAKKMIEWEIAHDAASAGILPAGAHHTHIGYARRSARHA